MDGRSKGRAGGRVDDHAWKHRRTRAPTHLRDLQPVVKGEVLRDVDKEPTQGSCRAHVRGVRAWVRGVRGCLRVHEYLATEDGMVKLRTS